MEAGYLHEQHKALDGNHYFPSGHCSVKLGWEVVCFHGIPPHGALVGYCSGCALKSCFLFVSEMTFPFHDNFQVSGISLYSALE